MSGSVGVSRWLWWERPGRSTISDPSAWLPFKDSAARHLAPTAAGLSAAAGAIVHTKRSL